MQIVATFIVIVVAAVAIIFTLRVYLEHFTTLGAAGKSLAGFLNGLQITVLNSVYQMVAIGLTKWENHRTDTEYEDSLVAKLFAFQFVNSYSSLFYIAFLKSNIRILGKSQECHPSCMNELGLQLGIVFATQIFVQNSMEIGIPLVKRLFAVRKRMKAKADVRSHVTGPPPPWCCSSLTCCGTRARAHTGCQGDITAPG